MADEYINPLDDEQGAEATETNEAPDTNEANVTPGTDVASDSSVDGVESAATFDDDDADMSDEASDTVESVYTLEEYLCGIVRMTVSDAALKSICARLHLSVGSSYESLSEKQVDLATAWLYVWIAGSPSTSQKVSDKDGDWSHSEGGESLSASVLRGYLNMANALFKKWGEPTIQKDRWGFIGGGLHNIRNYGGRRRRG